MDYFSVKNWEKHQHYKDRNPPWIKLHKDLLHDYEFTCLQDASKLHLMLIWLLASQMDNKIPADSKWLKNALHVDEDINLKALSDAGYIDIDSNVLADCNHHAMPEAEAQVLTEAEANKEMPENLKVSMPPDFDLNDTNKKWIDDSNLTDDEKTEAVKDFIDYWTLDESKKTNKGWQMAFRRNPIVKRKIVNSKHRGQGNGYEQKNTNSSGKKSLAERATDNRIRAEQQIDDQSMGENDSPVRS
jgi:hypothetical protein